MPRVQCPLCGGTGTRKLKRCGRCKGMGSVIIRNKHEETEPEAESTTRRFKIKIIGEIHVTELD